MNRLTFSDLASSSRDWCPTRSRSIRTRGCSEKDQAKCTTASTPRIALEAAIRSSTRPSTNSRRGCPAGSADSSWSSTTTSFPHSSSAGTRSRPTLPLPPVTRMRMAAAAPVSGGGGHRDRRLRHRLFRQLLEAPRYQRLEREEGQCPGGQIANHRAPEDGCPGAICLHQRGRAPTGEDRSQSLGGVLDS